MDLLRIFVAATLALFLLHHVAQLTEEPMLNAKLSRIKILIEQREAIDAELAGILGITEPAGIPGKKRGRPKKNAEAETSAQLSLVEPHS